MHKLGLLLAVAGILTLSACGGGGGGGRTLRRITAVNVTCSPTTVTSGRTSTMLRDGERDRELQLDGHLEHHRWVDHQFRIIYCSGGDDQLVGHGDGDLDQDTTKSGTASVTVNPTTTTRQRAAHRCRPRASRTSPEWSNIPYTTVTVCVPGTNYLPVD